MSTAPVAARHLTVEEFRQRERLLRRGFSVALALMAIGTIITTVIWTLATARHSTLDSLGRPATPAEIDEIVRASSLEAELLLIAAGALWLSVAIAVATAHLLARLRAASAARR